jgi:rRNA maturation RNase YbeY
LHEKNRSYLGHDTFTDIITFDYSDRDLISGDIFISIDRVRENAPINNTPFENELSRVIIHGILHLLGYKDKGKKEKEIMRKKEDFYLSLQT